MLIDLITVSTPRGEMPVYVYTPDEGRDQPLVVLFMDAPGIRPALEGHAGRLAKAGYRVALPNLYYNIAPVDLPRPERLAAGDAEEFSRMAAVVAQLSDDDILEDTELLLEALRAHPDEPWGCVGFCMGGRFGLRAAESAGETLAAAALLHPSGLVTDSADSPHLAASRVRGALYLGYGENDHVTPLDAIPPLQAEFEKGSVAHQIEIIPNADHGFTMPGLPAYNEQAAERAWSGTLKLLGDRLPITA